LGTQRSTSNRESGRLVPSVMPDRRLQLEVMAIRCLWSPPDVSTHETRWKAVVLLKLQQPFRNFVS
jgi:hypothetical protein